jgi:dipeptidyl aminopeptidase/acylaminoacyl peptidase
LDVNYGGNTGFGRDYRERLYGNWGIVDVEDCINGAKFLAAQGMVDEKRAVISGGSAGGYTTLAALVFQDFFRVERTTMASATPPRSRVTPTSSSHAISTG